MPLTTDSALPADTRAAIEALLTEFYWRLDHPDDGTVADLFIAEGTIVTPRFELAGRDAIATWFAARPRRTSRHSWSNLRLSATEGGVDVDAYLTTAAAPLAAGAGGADIMISETRDRVVATGNARWLFASRRLTTVFEGQLAPGSPHAP